MRAVSSRLGALSRLDIPPWFLAFVPFKLGEGLLITLLPLYVVQVAHGSLADVGRVNSSIALAGVLAFTLWGNLSDRLGRRRPFLFLGFLGFALCTIALARGQTIPQVLLLATIAGFFIAAITPVASALVLDSIPDRERGTSFGRFYQITAWSFVGGVLLGASWLTWQPANLETPEAMRMLLLFAGGFAFVSCLLCIVLVREARQFHSRRRYTPQFLGRLSVAIIERRALFYPSRMLYFLGDRAGGANWRDRLSHPLILYYCCAAVFFFSINLVYIPFPIFLTDVLDATNAQVFVITLGKAAIEALFYMPVGRLVQQRSGITLQVQATAVRVIIFVIFTAVALGEPTRGSLVLVGMTHLLTGVTWAAINVSSTTAIAALANKGQEGMAIGLYNAILGVAAIVGSTIAGQLANRFGYGVCFASGAVLTALTAFWLLSLQPTLAAKTNPQV
jgi:MFS family permease